MKSCQFLFIAILLSSCFQHESFTTQKVAVLPEVVQIYPSNDSLPENLLRFYIQFSKPMKAVGNLENIKLLNEDGVEIKGAIFNNVYELWDSNQELLTLILDPSRVKTGLVAHESLGRALVPGKHFRLVIEKAEDVDGNPMSDAYEKSFLISTADFESPDMNQWNITTPKRDTQNPLKIDFRQNLDWLSILSRIRVVNNQNELVKGRAEVLNQEKQLSFFPENRWARGQYTLQVIGRLEDPSGNNLNGLFDHQAGSLKTSDEGQVYTLKWTIE